MNFAVKHPLHSLDGNLGLRSDDDALLSGRIHRGSDFSSGILWKSIPRERNARRSIRHAKHSLAKYPFQQIKTFLAQEKQSHQLCQCLIGVHGLAAVNEPRIYEYPVTLMPQFLTE